MKFHDFSIPGIFFCIFQGFPWYFQSVGTLKWGTLCYRAHVCLTLPGACSGWAPKKPISPVPIPSYALSLSDHIDLWKQQLAQDPARDFILDGLTHGFRIIEQHSEIHPAECENYKSATNPEVYNKVEEAILSELCEGRYIATQERPKIISALGAIPKSNSDKIRLIHDASRPANYGLNSLAQPESFKYQTMDEAVANLAPSHYIAKVDLASAYRCVKIHPDCFDATGLKWKFNGNTMYMYDSRLPFGCSKNPYISNTLIQSVCRMMKRQGIMVICYMDDFLVIGKTMGECKEGMDRLLALRRKLGFQISWPKVQNPSQKLIFLGVEIDISGEAVTLRLPDEKLQQLKNLISDFKCKVRASKRQLQSLAGKLDWACQVIRGGRTFLRRIIDSSNKLGAPHYKYKLSHFFYQDIIWWDGFQWPYCGHSISHPLTGCGNWCFQSCIRCVLQGGLVVHSMAIWLARSCGPSHQPQGGTVRGTCRPTLGPLLGQP